MWKNLLCRTLDGYVRQGSLTVRFPDGTGAEFGDGGAPRAGLRISDPSLLPRLARNPELALGEGYTDGGLTVDSDDLHALLELAVRNLTREHRDPLHGLAARLRDAFRSLKQYNPAGRARANVAHHYDLSGALYDLFLDADRQYSCAYFSRPGMTLEEAQRAKKAHVAAKLCLEPGMQVLDIGCGWGGLALGLARDHGVRVIGITLSEEQHRFATARAATMGLDDRVQFQLCDYRAVEGRFDRIVSVGMFEHVGAPQFDAFFRVLSDRLVPAGVALVHTIGRAAPPGSTNPWISRHIFPGGYVPALSEVMAAVERQGLYQTDVEVWRLHYAMTLRHWHDRFMSHFDRVRRLYDDRFCRMWRFYLVACEQGFRFGRHCVFQIQLAHRQDAVPLSRDYLYSGPVPLAHAAQ